MATGAYHCELAWTGGDRPAADVLVEVDGDRIASVAEGVAATPGAVRLPGLTLPGFANSHSHAFQRALRGRTHDRSGSFWTWREQMYELAGVLEPESYHRLARAVFAEMALAGVACVGEFHYLHHRPDGSPYADPNAFGAALVAAAAEAGVRITLLDACYLHGGVDAPLDGVQRRFGDGTVERWMARVEDLLARETATARVGVAIHSVRAVDPDAIAAIARWAGERDLVVHAHVSEQEAENDDCRRAFGVTPTALLSNGGALDRRFTAVHATHVSEHDVALLARHGCTVCVCPTTERDLADGIGPTGPLRDAGVPMSLGTDSHATIDVLEEARALEHDERLATRRRANHPAAALLRAATVDGHRCLGWADAGRLEPGALADLVTIDLMSVRTAGTTPAHALAAAVFAAGAADVRHVVVGGQVVAADGRHRSVDVAAELAAAVDAVWASAGRARP